MFSHGWIDTNLSGCGAPQGAATNIVGQSHCVSADEQDVGRPRARVRQRRALLGGNSKLSLEHERPVLRGSMADDPDRGFPRPLETQVGDTPIHS